MKKRMLSILLCFCMALCLLPTAVLAASYDGWPSDTTSLAPGDPLVVDGKTYFYDKDISSTGKYFTDSNDTPVKPTVYKAGSGYVLFTPADSTTNPATPATLTLHDATISSTGGDAALKLGGNFVIILEGNNSITHQNRVIFCDGGALIVEGPGKLSTFGSVGLAATSITIQNEAILDISYPNGTSGINSSAGDVVIKDSTVTVESDESGSSIGSGAILANDNQNINGGNSNVIITNSKIIAIDSTGKAINANFGGITLTNSNVVAIGEEDSFGAIYNDYGEGHYVTVDGGTLYVKNTGDGYDITYSKQDTAINGAVIYCGGKYSSLFGSSGKNAQFSDCIYDKTSNKVTGVGAGRLCGDWTYSDDLPLPDTEQVTLKSPGTLTIPSNVTEDMSNILRIDSGATLKNDGTLNIPGGMMLYGAISGSGRLNGVVMTTSGATYTYTASGDAVYSDFVKVGKIKVNTTDTENKLVIPENTTLTVSNGAILDLTANGLTADNLKDYFTVSGEIANNGIIQLPQGITAEQIAILPLTGNGLVRVVTAYDSGVPSAWNTYTNDGKLITVDGDLILTETEVLASENKGYTWIKDGTNSYTLTLNDVYINGMLSVPSNCPVMIVTNTKSVINDSLSFSGGYGDNVTFKGNGTLTIRGALRANGSPSNNITVDGTRLNVDGNINIYGSGNNGDTEVFRIINGAAVYSGDGVYCSTVLVSGKSQLTSKSDSCAVMSLANDSKGGNVTVTDGSTLTVSCKYGVYIIGGKLTVDDTSSLIANASLAPFCVVDKTGKKQESETVSLPKIPSGMSISSVQGKDSGCGYTYWSLISNEKLSVEHENSEPATLSGAVKGSVTFKNSQDNSGNSGNGGNGSSGGKSSTTTYTVTATAGTGGSISPNGKISVASGDKKTFTITTDEGHMVKDVLVDGVSVGAVTTYTFEKVIKAHTITVSFKKKTDNVFNGFTDVKEKDWFKSAVDYVTGKGLMNGTKDDKFDPYISTDRGMIVTILWRMENKPQVSANAGFADVKEGIYYTKAVDWAVENAIVKGYGNGNFGPEDTITREQMAAILYRYSQFKKYDTTQGGMAVREFPDSKEISSWAMESMTWAVNAGMISGKENHMLDPRGNATRAEAASILMRYCQNVAK